MSKKYRITKYNVSDSILPAGYLQVEYILSSGIQYINTNYIPNSNTKIVISLFCLNYNDGGIAGSGNDYSTADGLMIGKYGNKVLGYAGGANNLVLTNGITGDRYIITAKVSQFHITFANGTSRTVDTGKTALVNPSRALYLFSCNTGNSTLKTHSSLKIEYLKIYEDDVLVRNFVPAINSSNTIGMYETETSTFKTNSGSGSFTAGPKTSKIKECLTMYNTGSLPSIYELLEYIKTDGTARINTGITSTVNSNIDIGFKLSNIPSSLTGIDAYLINGISNNWNYNSYTIYYRGLNALVDSGKISFHGNSDVLISSLSTSPIYKVVTTSNGTNTVLIQTYSNNSLLSTVNGSISNIGTTNTFTLLGKDDYTKPLGFLLRYCKIWNSDELVFDGIPCKRSRDNVIGMYNLVNSTFYTNVAGGTSSFIAGPVIPTKKYMITMQEVNN